MTLQTLAVCLAAVAFAAFAPRSALAFELQPISREFAAVGAGATQSYEIVNRGDAPVALGVSVVTRELDVNGEESNQDAGDDFLVYPPQLIVAAGGRQTLRVSYLGDPQPAAERAFRLVVEQVPIELLSPGDAHETSPSAMVKVLLNYRGSLYVRPRHARAGLEVEAVQREQSASGEPLLAVTVRNTGTARATLREYTLKTRARGGSAPVELSPKDLPDLKGSVVLPHGRRRLLFSWPRQLPRDELDVAMSIALRE